MSGGDPFAEPGGTTCDIDSFQPECNPQGNCRERSGNDVCDASTVVDAVAVNPVWLQHPGGLPR